ncbi:MAG: transporter, partial [Flavobacterium sp.]|nr:transporter [Flavobacterium sp.]
SGDFYSDAIATAGAAYLINKNIQVDASISKNFKNTPDIIYGGIGISWRNDKNYREVKIATSKEGKKRIKENKKDDKKSNTKKRVDNIDFEKSK